MSILTDEQLLADVAAGMSGHAIAKKYGMTPGNINRTLAAKDAYAARGGWFSGRSTNVITYHKQYGEVSRQSISPEMLK